MSKILPQTMVSDFYTVCSVQTKKTDNVVQAGMEIQENFIAQKSPKQDLYAVRRYLIETKFGDSLYHPFDTFIYKVCDFFNGYSDFTLTFDEAVNKLREFEVKNSNKGSDFENDPNDPRHYSRYTAA